jgi:spore coat polysaccharide biosynthesis predicted glycosyltransferase SpsG
LRPPFWGVPRRRIDEEFRSVLVVTGAGGGDLGAELTHALEEALPRAEVTLVRGPYAPAAPPGVSALEAPESLLEPLFAADLVVGGAGQTILEAAATGAPSVALPLVENQRRQARGLADEGAVCLVDPPTVAAAVDAACGLAADPDARRILAERAQGTVDGFGALRVAYHVAVLAHEARS